MHRLYNPNTGERLNTAVATGRDNPSRAGWRYEDAGRVAPAPGSPRRGIRPHSYTTSLAESGTLARAGRVFEGRACG